MPERLKVLVVGQTPPPYHGQAIMIERLLRGQYAHVELLHVRMAFSDSMNEVGRFHISKLFHLIGVIARIIFCRCFRGATVLCYPPAGPNRVPLYRDLAILLSTRWMFRRTILYFHAGGVSQLYPQLSRPMQRLFRWALFNADAAIRISQGSPGDARMLQARREYIVPNGIEDELEHHLDLRSATTTEQKISADQKFVANTHLKIQPSVASEHPNNFMTATMCETAIAELPPLRILFVGMLCESKGLSDLIEACGRLAAHGVSFSLKIVGQFVSTDFADQTHRRVRELDLESHVQFAGMLRDQAKWEALAQVDVLCLPTFYEAETFGVVLVEAMSFGLPVVATRWRGIPEIVDDHATGFLVEPHNVQALTESLEKLHADPQLRQRLGQAGREKFLRDYTVERYWKRMEQVFIEVAKGEPCCNL